MSKDTGALDDLLHEDRRFPPPEDFARRAVVSDPSVYERAATDREAYWAEWAARLDTIGYEIVCGISERVPRVPRRSIDG